MGRLSYNEGAGGGRRKGRGKSGSGEGEGKECGRSTFRRIVCVECVYIKLLVCVRGNSDVHIEGRKKQDMCDGLLFLSSF